MSVVQMFQRAPAADVAAGGAPKEKRRRSSLSWSMRIGLGILAFYLTVALISCFWTPYDPLQPGAGESYVSPSGSREWWISFFPGLAILGMTAAFYLLGEAIADASDPRRRR